jgi:hypothetical protein
MPSVTQWVAYSSKVVPNRDKASAAEISRCAIPTKEASFSTNYVAKPGSTDELEVLSVP